MEAGINMLLASSSNTLCGLKTKKIIGSIATPYYFTHYVTFILDTNATDVLDMLIEQFGLGIIDTVRIFPDFFTH